MHAILIDRAPFGNDASRQAVDLALACAAFEVPIALVFCGAGALHLQPLHADSINGFQWPSVFRQFALYGIEKVYADAGALHRLGVDTQHFPVAVVPLDEDALQNLIARAPQVWSF